MAVTKAHIESVNKYNKKTYETFLTRLRKGIDPSCESITAAAERKGMSLNAYVIQAIEEQMKRDGAEVSQNP